MLWYTYYVLPVNGAIFDLPVTLTLESIHVSPSVLLNPENVDFLWTWLEILCNWKHQRECACAPLPICEIRMKNSYPFRRSRGCRFGPPPLGPRRIRKKLGQLRVNTGSNEETYYWRVTHVIDTFHSLINCARRQYRLQWKLNRLFYFSGERANYTGIEQLRYVNNWQFWNNLQLRALAEPTIAQHLVSTRRQKRVRASHLPN